MSSGFISETALAERRKIREELWQKNRNEGDPEEPPEEPVPDNRSLYEKLKEQKDKKQEEWEEAHKLKNMVRGLEDDEVDFLDLVDTTKIQEERRIKAEEQSALEEYRKRVSELQKKAVESEVLTELKSEIKRDTGMTKKKSQASLLAGAIKRKRSESEDDKTTDGAATSKLKVEESNQENEDKVKEGVATSTTSTRNGLQCVAVLPGLGEYTDSSNSDYSDSETDLEGTNVTIARDITGRIIHLHTSGSKGCC